MAPRLSPATFPEDSARRAGVPLLAGKVVHYDRLCGGRVARTVYYRGEPVARWAYVIPLEEKGSARCDSRSDS